MNSGIIANVKETINHAKFSLQGSDCKYTYFKNKTYLYDESLKTYFEKKSVTILFNGLQIDFTESESGIISDININTRSENINAKLFVNEFIKFISKHVPDIKDNNYNFDTFNGCIFDYILKRYSHSKMKDIILFYKSMYNSISNYMKLKAIVLDPNPTQQKKLRKLSEKVDIDDLYENPFYIIDENNNKFIDIVLIISKQLNTESSKVITGIIKHVILNFMSNGHTCVPFDVVNKQSFLQLCKYYGTDTIEDIPTNTDIEKIMRSAKQFYIVDEMIMIKKIYNIVNYVSDTLQSLIENYYEGMDGIDEGMNEGIGESINDYEKEQDIKFSAKQLRAIKLPFESNYGICMLTGLPGSGKTSCVKCIKYVIEKMNKKFILAAPTGKSANKMDKNAYTIHRLLETLITKKEKYIYRRNESNTFTTDYLIIDETSMIDVELFYHLLKACPKNIMIILIGDTNQLPCIRYGEVLKSLVDTNLIEHVHLSTIYRQGSESEIPILSKLIVQKSSDIPKFLKKAKTIKYINNLKSSESINQYILNSFKKNKNLQILIPMNVGSSGTKRINNLIHEYLYPNTTTFQIGERIICTSNSYAKNSDNSVDIDSSMLNGETGFFDGYECDRSSKIKYKYRNKIIKSDNNVVIIDDGTIDYGYAITVHKSQGSEYDDVLIYLPESNNSSFSILNNQLLYTAVTRTKRNLTIISDDDTLNYCINNYANNRYDIMSKLLTAGIEVIYE